MVPLSECLQPPLSLQPLDLDEEESHLPVTPTNRSFATPTTESFVTAILSPSSHEVFAARARARSRSDAPTSSAAALKAAAWNAVHYSPSLDSISAVRLCNPISEGNTSPRGMLLETDGTNILSPLSTHNDSPTIARRSRLLSSAGAGVCIAPQDSRPLKMQVSSQSAIGSALPGLRASVTSRPRATTISAPNTSPYLFSNQSHLLNGTAVPHTSIQPSRLRALSNHCSERRIHGKDAYILASPPVSPSWKGSEHPKSSKLLTTQLPSQSSQVSLDSRYDSSFEASLDANEISLTFSTSLSDAFDNSQDKAGSEASLWRPEELPKTKTREWTCEYPFQEPKEPSYLPIVRESKVVSVRRKSHTISDFALPFRAGYLLQSAEGPDQQDVFGPTRSLHLSQAVQESGQSGQDLPWTLQDSKNLPSSTSNLLLSTGRVGGKPRRQTVGSGGFSPTVPRTPVRSVLHRQHKPEGTSPQGCGATVCQKTTVEQEQRLTAFQELIQGLVKERPIQSCAIEEGVPAEPQSIGAVLEYRRRSPTGRNEKNGGGQECELCGAFAGRLTILEPCGHFACAVCCSSGLNQVTATPPRQHTCAACHTPVIGITLCKNAAEQRRETDWAPSSIYAESQTPSGIRRRPQTPSLDEQKFLYGKENLSSPSKVAIKSPGQAGPTRRRASTSRGGHCSVAKSKVSDLANESGETTSSDLLTEDQSFYQSQRRLQPQKKRAAPSNSRSGSQYNTSKAASRKDSVGVIRSETLQGTSIVRIDNIPWTVTYSDVVEWLPQPHEAILPDGDFSSASIHVPIDVFSGKTSNCCFVECKNKEEAMRLVRHRNNTRLLGRPVSLILTTLTDLLDEIFPSRAGSPSLEDNECVFFTAVHLRQLVELLRRGGAQLKGPLKIVDVTTSMIRLVPANMKSVLSEMLFHRTKEIVCICIAASQDMSAIRQSLDRLLLACSYCACFSVSQRIEIFNSAEGTLTAVSQVKRGGLGVGVPLSAPPPLAFVSLLASSHSRREPLKELNGNKASRPKSHGQQSLLSTDTCLSQEDLASLAQPTFQSENLPWQTYSSPGAEKTWTGGAPLGTLPPAYAPLTPASLVTSFHRPAHAQPSSEYREAAMRALVSYGIRPTVNTEGFEKMVNQLAQAFAKQ